MSDPKPVNRPVMVRGSLGAEGMLALVSTARNPRDVPELRARLIEIVNHPDRSWATDDGLRYDEYPHPVRTYPGLVTWSQVWDMVRPGITQERVDELRAAFAAVDEQQRWNDLRLHFAVCALLSPPPAPVQLDLFAELANA
jgi:hypothetical protein